MKNSAFEYHLGIIQWHFSDKDGWERIGNIDFYNSKKEAIENAKQIWQKSNKNVHAGLTVLERVIVVDPVTGRIIFERLNLKPLVYWGF